MESLGDLERDVVLVSGEVFVVAAEESNRVTFDVGIIRKLH